MVREKICDTAIFKLSPSLVHLRMERNDLMSNVRCPRCGGEALGEARFCPNCGARLPTQEISPLAAILVIVLTFIILAFGFPLLYIIDLPLTPQLVSAVGELTVLLIPLIYMLHKKVNVVRYAMFGSLKHVVFGLGLGIGLLGVNIAVSLVLTYLVGPSALVEETNEAIFQMAQVSPVAMILVATGFVLAGVCEEFAFRGFLQNALRSRYSSCVALLGASLAFGLFHPDPQAIYIIEAFVIGLLLGYFYNRLRSYILVATAHATINMISLSIILILA